MIPDVRSSDDKTYSCTVSNNGGSVKSDPVKLTVTGKYQLTFHSLISLHWCVGLPKIFVLPFSQSVEAMQSAKFNTAMSGIGVENFTYQWKHNGEEMNGETGDTLNLININGDKEGLYQCIVKNQYGDSDISSAKLIVKCKKDTL